MTVLNFGCETYVLVFIPLQTKFKLLYLKTKFVPRSKHFISVIKTIEFIM